MFCSCFKFSHSKKAQRRSNSSENSKNEAFEAVDTGNLKILHKLTSTSAGCVKLASFKSTEDGFGDSLLHRAARKQRPGVCRMLLLKGFAATSKNNDGDTAFNVAAASGNFTVVKEFVGTRNYIFNINVKGSRGRTSLHQAAELNHVEIVRFLCWKGADLLDKDDDGNTAFHLAAISGCLETIEKMTNEWKAEVNSKSANGKTALYYSIVSDHSDLVKFLLSHGAALDSLEAPEIDENGNSLLTLAAAFGSIRVAKMIVEEKGYDVDKPDENGVTALQKSVCANHVTVVRYLLEKGAIFSNTDENGNTAVHCAAKIGCVEVMECLINENGADFGKVNDDGLYPIHLASAFNKIAVSRFLLKKGVDVDVKAKNGDTPLISAATNGSLQVVEILLEEWKPDVNLKGSNGCTALLRAAENGFTDIGRCLLTHGADVTDTTLMGDSVLSVAVASDHTEFACMLINEFKADVDATSSKGQSVLHWAAAVGNSKITKVLLENDAKAYARDNEDNTALHWAASDGHLGVVKELVVTGELEVFTQGQQGRTALHVAARHNQVDVAQFLLIKGANVHARDIEGNTPLHQAVFFGAFDVARLLVEAWRANPVIDNYIGHSPVFYSQVRGYPEIKHLLQNHEHIFSLRRKHSGFY